MENFDKNSLPSQYKPLSAWAYWGLSLLYAVPVVGLIFMIIFTFKKTNINRRNFTRSFWITYIMIAIIYIILFALGVTSGLLESIPY